MKVDTVEQFKCLQFIKENFDMDCIKLEKHNNFTLKIIDQKNKELYVYWMHGKVQYDDEEPIPF